MECEVIKCGLVDTHVAGEDVLYSVMDPDDIITNEVLSETELFQEILVNEIRKFVQQSVERRELRRSIRKQGRKKRKLLLQDGQTEAADAGPKATSRYCLSYFFEVIKSIRNCPRKRQLLSDIGFGGFLELEECIVPRAFAQWLADGCSFDDDNSILIHNRILMNAHSVKDTFDIPSGDLAIDLQDEDGKLAFLAQFALTDVPSIKYFGSMLMNEELPDDVFKRCFMAVNLGSFLCPTSSTKPSTKYLGSLVDVDNIKFLNWCKLVHDWLVCFIKKYNKDKLKGNKISLTLGGCLYHLAVRFLDFVDFGSILLPPTLPRIRVWKGDLIKHFSDMVIGRAVSGNAYPLKVISQTCYAQRTYTLSGINAIPNLEEMIKSVIGNYFSVKVQEGIYDCLKRHSIGESQVGCQKLLNMLIDVLNCITSEGSEPGGTQKIDSSDDNQHSFNANNFQNCENLRTDSNEKGSFPQVSTGNVNRKRSFVVEEHSPASAASESNKKAKINKSSTDSRLKRHHKLDLNENPVESNEEKGGTTSVMKECSVTKNSELGEQIRSTYKADVGKKPFTICEKSASFGHLVRADDSFNLNEAQCSLPGLSVLACKESSGVLALRKMLPEGTDNKFDGFVNSVTLEEGKCTVQEQQSSATFEYKSNPAYKIHSIACIAQQYGYSDSNGSMSPDPVIDFEELSKKYFFREDGCPSFRLFEFVDDNGKTIDEHELWRPLGMGDVEYASRIKEANCLLMKGKLKEDETDTLEESIHCAQRQSSENCINQSPCIPVSPKQSTIIIDSDTPDGNESNEWLLTSRKNIKNQSNTNTYKESLFSKSGLIGRQLFSDVGCSEQEELNHTKLSQDKKSTQPMTPEVKFMGANKSCAIHISPELQFMGETTKRYVPESPEVQCLGERSFNYVCNEMSESSDALYNAGLSLRNRSFSSGKENVRTKRVVNRSSYLCSPFEIGNSSTLGLSNTSRIEPVEVKLYDTITTLCDDPVYADTWVINMNNCRVTLKQLGCSTKPEGWVEAWVINAFCRKLFKDAHPRISQKHFFFHTSAEYFLEKWPNEKIRDIWQRNVMNNFKAADSARRLHLSHRIHFPALFNKHWFVFGVDLKAHKFLFMDSLFGESNELHEEVDDKMIANFINTWKECKFKDMHFETFGKMYPKLPKKKTPNDCGIFICKYMERYCTRDPKSCSFSAENVPEFRLRIAIDTTFNDYNSNVDEMDLIRTFDIESYKRKRALQ